MATYEIRTERRVPFEELTLPEVTVLPAYFIQAESQEDALDEFWLYVPIEVDGHFSLSINGA